MKAKLLSLLVVLFVCLPSFSQQKPMEKRDKDGIYLMPDKLPEYPGGTNALMKFLSDNIKYPVEAQKKGISGRVLIQFVVMEDGSLDNMKILRGVDPMLDEEAMRVVKTMPKWIPGMDKGDAVKVRFTLPISFNLSKNESPKMTFPELTVPVGQEVENKSLQGVWQSCIILPGEHDYKVILMPVLKIIMADNTFMNIMTGGKDGRSGAVIYTQGNYYMPSDESYVEVVKRSADTVFTEGIENELSVERLHDNLIKLSYYMPGQENGNKRIEYWHRSPSPNINIMAD